MSLSMDSLLAFTLGMAVPTIMYFGYKNYQAWKSQKQVLGWLGALGGLNLYSNVVGHLFNGINSSQFGDSIQYILRQKFPDFEYRQEDIIVKAFKRFKEEEKHEKELAEITKRFKKPFLRPEQAEEKKSDDEFTTI